MKIGLIGKGKTGGKVLELAKENIVHVFDSSNTPTADKMRECDVLIAFVPGTVLENILEEILKAGVPVVSGCTGFEFDEQFQDNIKANGITWIQGHNFSLGMNIIRSILPILNKASEVFPDFKPHIHEIHHTKKLDAPSGTAIKWKEWLGGSADITHEREGDVVGTHILTLNTPLEEITIKHESLERSLFAKGALWASEHLLGTINNKEKLPAGFYWFENIVNKELGI